MIYILIWKSISYPNDIYFFDILISESGPNIICFIYFDFEMYFVSQ